MAGYYVVISSDMDALHSELSSAVDVLLAALTAEAATVNKLISTDNISGNTAQRMKNYMSVVHGKIINDMRQCCVTLFELWECYRQDYRDQVDNAGIVHISSGELLNIREGCATYVQQTDNCVTAISSAISGVSDITAAASLGTDKWFQAIFTTYTNCEGYIDDLNDRIETIENKYKGHASLTTISDKIRDLLQIVNEYYGKKNMHWTDFDAAAVMQSPLYQRLEESSKDLDKTLADIDEAAKDAIAAEEAHFAKAQQEIELDALLAQEQRRKEMGWQKGAAVVLTLAVDIVVIVGTAGCAAPVVIGVTTAAGTATGAYSFAIDSKVNQYVEKGTIDLGEMGYESLKGGIVGGTTSLIGSSVGQWVKGIKEVDEIAKVLKPASKTVKTEAVKTLLTLGIDGSSSMFTGVTTGVVTRFEKAAMDSLHSGDGLGESLASGIHDAVNLTRIREDTVHGLTSAVTDYVLGELEDIIPGDLSDLERPKTKGEMASSIVRSGWIGGTENVISTIIDDTVAYFYDEDAEKGSFVEEVFNGGNIAKSALKGSTKKMAKTYGKEESEQLKQEIQQDLAAIEDDIMGQLNTRNDQVSLDLNNGEEIAEDSHQHIGLHESLSDEGLFETYEDGVYEEKKLGRSASQTLHYTPDTKRDKSAQLAAGGDDRRNDDHGFHLIGVAEGGSPGKENLDAGNGNLNQGSYRRRELSEISDLKEGASGFKHVESFKSNGSDRPDAFMGFTITEDKAGKRTWDAFSYQNENVKTQESWNKTADANSDYSNSIPNAMRDGNYDEIQKIIHQDDT